MRLPNFHLSGLNGSAENLLDYEGRVLLVVNVTSLNGER